MAVFLFDKIIFGPIQSRRLGNSLGVNLLPTDLKVCSFDCIYCECGFNPKKKGLKPRLPKREEVRDKLEKILWQNKENGTIINHITFAGNGEPTLHPDFLNVIDDTISLRNKIFSKAEITVLSNGTTVHQPAIFKALNKIENNVLKLDSGDWDTIKLLNNPVGKYDTDKVIQDYKKFDGNLIIQSLFVKGSYKGQTIDNTQNLEKWLKYINEIRPKYVMIYTIERDAPVDTLEKVNVTELKAIGTRVEKLGIKTQISG